MMKNLIYFLFIVFPTMVWGQTLDVANVSSSQELIDQLLGEGVEISNFTVHGDLRQTGTFNDPIGILGVRNGLVMGTGDVSYAEPPNRPFNSGIYIACSSDSKALVVMRQVTSTICPCFNIIDIRPCDISKLTGIS